MDIQKRRSVRRFSINRFTLNAIATAILAFRTETASAVNCPSFVVDTSLAGVVCDFATGSSVTVANGGVVGGINMASYLPTPPSHITINTGGSVSNATGIGIAISNSSLSNGLSNSGTISSTSATGIAISSGSTISGGIANSGLISAGTIGLSIADSVINEGILNTGTIISTASGTGIKISNISTINGGITNNGTITGGGVDPGIAILTNSTINSGIINTGLISAVNSDGILVRSSSVINGGITNSGRINSTDNTGIAIFNASNVQGDIFNSGTISGGTAGLSIHNSSTVSGSILNSGTINGANRGISVFSATTISGGITNSGTVSSDAIGVAIASSSTISGGISNSGIISSGATGIAISSNSTINDGITNSGSITSTDNTGISINASNVQGNIFNSGTISSGIDGLSIDNASTVSGSIINSGTVSSDATGIAISSNSTINGGISNSGTIQGGTKAIYIAAGSTVNNIDIVGQEARIIGAVDAVDTILNITSGAVFTSEGSFNVNTFNIASNATFNMANTITANDMNNAGTLAVGETTRAVVGNYTQNAGGVFQLGVTSAANHGALTVTDAVNLAASGNINVQLAQNASLHAGDVLEIISGGTLTAPTNGYQVSDNSFIWQFTAASNLANNGVNLIAGINPAASAVCQGDYCQNAANVILGQVAAGNQAFGPYAALPNASALQTAASQATPELTNENIQVTQITTRAVMDTVPMWGALHGKSAGDAMLSDPGKVWVKPYVASIIQNESNSIEGYNASAYGLVVGKDLSLAENGMFGGALALGKDNMRGRGQLSGQTIYSDTYQALVYGAGKLPHNLYLAGQGLIGFGRNDTSRSIPLYGSSAEGSFNSWYTNLRAQLGWNVYALNQSLVLTPQFDASYLKVYQGGYHESGSAMDLSVSSNNNSSLVLGVYGNGAYHLTSFNQTKYLTLSAYAGVARDVLNTQPQTTATFVAGGPSFSTFGVQFNKTVFRGGVGLNIANPTKPLRVSVNYDAQTGNNAYSGIGSVTINYKL